MDFDHSKEIITPDITEILTIGGNALELPVGITAARPVDTATGGIRYNTTIDDVEILAETGWRPVSSSPIITTNTVVVGGIETTKTTSGLGSNNSA